MAKSKTKKANDAPVEDVIDTKAKADQAEADLAKAEAEAKAEETKGDKDESDKDNSKSKEADTPAKTEPTQEKSKPAPEADADETEAKSDVAEAETVDEVLEEAEEDGLTAKKVADQLAENPDVTLKELAIERGNYLNLPQALRDAEASQEQIHTPTGTRRTPPMNPFMKIQQERESKAVKSDVPTAADMAELIKKKLKVDTANHFVLGSIVAKLNNYVTNMAPNTPVGTDLGSRWQAELANCFFEALAATPEASIVSLQILELYFTEYRNHAFARTHAFRFMESVRLDQQRLIAFQSLLHLFVELGNKEGRTKSEIQRQVNIGKIAESISDNTDAQVRLVEFLN